MELQENKWQRGAEWRRWDLHVHTPESLLGDSFTGVQWEEYADALNRAAKERQIAVIGVTDYMTIDGYEKLLQQQRDSSDFLKDVLLLPNIEFRCLPPTKNGNALNIHLVVDVKDIDHVKNIKRTLQKLEFKYDGQPYGCSREELIRFAKAQKQSLTDELAYKFGIEQFKPSYTDIFSWLDSDQWLATNSVIGIANGKDGISGLPLDAYASTRDELLRQAHFIFSGNPSDRQHYLGLKPDFPPSEIMRQYKSLKPCFHGSDAHSIEKLFEPDFKRYCWVKADPTFRGLQQAIREPESRVFIGENGVKPEKMTAVENDKTSFIDKIEIRKLLNSPINDSWLDGCSLPLNSGLVAIIGNKGSGKSALADVIASLGNSAQIEHFSFLKKDRFRGAKGAAKNFEGSLTWLDATEEKRNLNKDAAATEPELVRYIPQGHFEALCQAHVLGESDDFEQALESVIFNHLEEKVRLGASDFKQLAVQQESNLQQEIDEYRNQLTSLNQKIALCEERLQPGIKKELESKLALVQRQIEEHGKTKPAELQKPTEEITPEQKKITEDIEQKQNALQALNDSLQNHTKNETALSYKLKSYENIKGRIDFLTRAFQAFQHETTEDFKRLGLTVESLVTFKLNENNLNNIVQEISLEQTNIASAKNRMAAEKIQQEQALSELKKQLDAPQRAYQQSLIALNDWKLKESALIGKADSPSSETHEGIKAQIAIINNLPNQLAELRNDRKTQSGAIFDLLDKQRKGREELYKPVQELIQSNPLILEEHKLQFQAELKPNLEKFIKSLFELIHYLKGDFNNIADARLTVQKIAEKHHLNSKEGALGFLGELEEKIRKIAEAGEASIVNILRKDKAASEVYDLLFDLSFLETRYSLLIQDAKIEQLSPGQRGALLLIFYLLVDKGKNPIILDQPEENLDNKTVFELLVPIIREAKKKRQIIMVTHNPNLAVVCDAEQIIYSSFERAEGYKISYLAGAIENPEINKHVVDVLEGTKPAFNNRREKYL